MVLVGYIKCIASTCSILGYASSYIYRYRSDSTLPGHTKSYFAKYDILSIQNVIVLNALVFMRKARHFPLDLPRSVIKTIAENSPPPPPGATHESSNEWLQNLSYYLYTRSVFIKAHWPLLSIIPEIAELVTPPTVLPCLTQKFTKKMYEKSSGDAE